MGVTGGFVRTIFSRNRSFGAHEHNGRSNVGEKKRWSSVRSYLCGDEHTLFLLWMTRIASAKTLDLVPANDDSASVKSSEATVTQPVQEDVSVGCNVDSVKKDITHKEDNQSEATETQIPKKHQTSISNLFREEDVAIIIQRAFRSYLATRRDKGVGEKFTEEESFVGAESPSKESMGTSLEVQTGNPVNAFYVVQDSAFAKQRTRQKNRAQVLKIKEDWDDSTVSSTISKLRTQNRVEAMTRRERALAYAFSQQLRICSKKKQMERNDDVDHNITWSWLERWMATRVPESISVEQGTNYLTEPVTRNQILVMKKRSYGVAGELESCSSNDVSLHLESIWETQGDNDEDSRVGKNSLKATRNISMRPSHQIHREMCSAAPGNKEGSATRYKESQEGIENTIGLKREINAQQTSRKLWQMI